MSQSQLPAGLRTRRGNDGPTTLTDADAVQGVLDAIDDTDCRAILETTREDAHSVTELAEACDLPLSTAYRKVDVLADADLIEESIRIRQSGKHVSEYTCGVDDVTLSVDAEAGIELVVSHAEIDASATFGSSFDRSASVADD